jgi:hypothetical protein
MESPVNEPMIRESKERPDLLDPQSPPGLRVVQITTDNRVASSHVYMEAPIFTPDSRRFIYFRLGNPRERDSREHRRQYMICDIADRFAGQQITNELGATGPAVSPDGKYMYYLVDETRVGGSRIRLKRVLLDTLWREEIIVIDRALPGCDAVPSRLYPLSSISPDGKRLCTSAHLGNGLKANASWGLIVFDLEKVTAEVVLQGSDYCNMHPQYCHNAKQGHDILVQHNHGSECDASGKIVTLTGGEGADVHVVRDDGSNFRDMPWGRDGVERCQGHQCWRGAHVTAVSSMSSGPDALGPLVEALPAQTDKRHTGKLIPGAWRNEISRNVQRPFFCHFAFDPTGTKFVSDFRDPDDLQRKSSIVIGSLGEGKDSALRIRHLLHPRATWKHGQQSHPHPFLSPDGRWAFFNSNESGLCQIFAIEGFAYP